MNTNMAGLGVCYHAFYKFVSAVQYRHRAANKQTCFNTQTLAGARFMTTHKWYKSSGALAIHKLADVLQIGEIARQKFCDHSNIEFKQIYSSMHAQCTYVCVSQLLSNIIELKCTDKPKCLKH